MSERKCSNAGAALHTHLLDGMDVECESLLTHNLFSPRRAHVLDTSLKGGFHSLASAWLKAPQCVLSPIKARPLNGVLKLLYVDQQFAQILTAAYTSLLSLSWYHASRLQLPWIPGRHGTGSGIRCGFTVKQQQEQKVFILANAADKNLAIKYYFQGDVMQDSVFLRATIRLLHTTPS